MKTTKERLTKFKCGYTRLGKHVCNCDRSPTPQSCVDILVSRIQEYMDTVIDAINKRPVLLKKYLNLQFTSAQSSVGDKGRQRLWDWRHCWQASTIWYSCLRPIKYFDRIRLLPTSNQAIPCSRQKDPSESDPVPMQPRHPLEYRSQPSSGNECCQKCGDEQLGICPALSECDIKIPVNN